MRPFSMEEVKRAMFGIDENKAPGPDGFGSKFFKHSWNLVGHEVSSAILTSLIAKSC